MIRTIRNESITIVRRPSAGMAFRSGRAAVRMFGNDGTNGFDVSGSSVRRCRVLAKAQGIKFNRPAKPEIRYTMLAAPDE